MSESNDELVELTVEQILTKYPQETINRWILSGWRKYARGVGVRSARLARSTQDVPVARVLNGVLSQLDDREIERLQAESVRLMSAGK